MFSFALAASLAAFGPAQSPLDPSQSVQSPPLRSQSLSLDGTWSLGRLGLDADGANALADLTRAKRIPAAVPGEVHLALMQAGEMADPSVGSNSRKDRWPERYSWWYRRKFRPPDGFLQHDRQELVFDGLMYTAEVFVNGTKVGDSRNGLVRTRFDVRGAVREGENDLVVRTTSGYELVGKADEDFTGQKLYANRENFPVRSKLRTPPYMSGWDWCDTLPNIGIWRSVRLEGHSRAALSQVRLDPEISGKRVSLRGEITVQNLRAWEESPCRIQLTLERPNGPPITWEKIVTLGIGLNRVPCSFGVPEPQLWWPNGMGGQPLYRLTAKLLTANSPGEVLDERKQMIGLRTVELDRSPLADGSRFEFRVNGKEMFAKGGNWAPADQIPARMTAGRYRHFIEAAQEAHFNMLRVNGVGYYEDDAFYDACDRAGILLWQEFAYSCTTYDDSSAEFMEGARREAEEFVTRIANHPCLALWCGCNECLWMYADGKNPAPSESLGFNIYFDLLPSVLRALDPNRPYIAGSPCGGPDGINSQRGGDVHWWYEVFMSGDPARKMNPSLLDTCLGRFVSEYGIIGPPPLASMREYLGPEETPEEAFRSAGLAWRIHTNSYEGDHYGFTEAALRHHFFGDGPLSVEQFSLYGGLYQAMMQGQMVEACRFRKRDAGHPCDGVLMWSYNDCWGEVGWSIIDHYGRRKPSYYAVKRAAAPLKVIVRERAGKLVTRVVNDQLAAADAQVTYGWFRVDGSSREVKSRRIRVPANGMIEVARDPVAGGNPREWVYAAILSGPPGDACVHLLGTYRDLALPVPDIVATRRGDRITLTSNTFAVGVHLPDESDGVMSDDYFDLLPGIPHTVTITAPDAPRDYRFVPSLPQR